MILLQKNVYNKNVTSVTLLTDFIYEGLTCSNIDLGLCKNLYQLKSTINEEDIFDYIALQKNLAHKLKVEFDFNKYINMEGYDQEHDILLHKLKTTFESPEQSVNNNLMEYVDNSTYFYYFVVNDTIFLIASKKELTGKNIRSLNSTKLGKALLEALYNTIGYNELHAKSSLLERTNSFALFNVISLLANE